MAEKILTTPISAKDLEDIRIGDILWLDGLITTCRDVAHRRLIDDDRPLPISLSGGAIFHAGPIVRPVPRPQNDPSPTYQIVSIGPTTSMRMEKFEKEFIRQTGVRLIVGKGGMGPETMSACQKYKAIHCVFPAGCAVAAATSVEKIEAANWTELGMPETLWTCRVSHFGPLIVSIDTHGNNLFEKNKLLFNKRKELVCETISRQVQFIH